MQLIKILLNFIVRTAFIYTLGEQAVGLNRFVHKHIEHIVAYRAEVLGLPLSLICINRWHKTIKKIIVELTKNL